MAASRRSLLTLTVVALLVGAAAPLVWLVFRQAPPRGSTLGGGATGGQPDPVPGVGPTPPKGSRPAVEKDAPNRPLLLPPLTSEQRLLLARAHTGGGYPNAAPPELAGLLGDVRFRMRFGGAYPTWSADGKRLAVGSDHEVMVFDVPTGRRLHHLGGHTGMPLRLAFSPDGKHLASAGEDRTVRVWDLDSAQAVSVFQGHASHVWGLDFHPLGKLLASASLDGSLRLWDLETGRLRTVIQSAHGDWVNSVAFSADGRWLASGGQDHKVRLWEVDTGKPTHVLDHDPAGFAIQVCWTPAGNLAAGSETELRLWDVASGEQLWSLQTPAGFVAVTPDGNTLLTAAQEYEPGAAHEVCRWSLEGSRPEKLGSYPLASKGGQVYCDLSPDGRLLAAVAHPQGRSIQLYDAQTGQPQLPEDAGHTATPETLVFSADGKTLYSAGNDGVVRVWDVRRGERVRTLDGHKGIVRGLALRPGDRVLATGGHDATIKLWATDTGQCLRTLTGHSSGIESLAWSPDGKRLISGSLTGEVGVWRWDHGDVVTVNRAHTQTIEGIAFTPQGDRFVTTSLDRTALVHSLHGRTAPRKLNYTQSFLQGCFDVSGRLLVGHGDGTLSVWPIDRDEPERTLSVSSSAAHTVVLRPDGKMLATTGSEGCVRLWDLRGDQPRCRCWPVAPVGQWVTGLAFSPDGRLLAVGLPEGPILLHCLADDDQPLPEYLPGERLALREENVFTSHTHQWVGGVAVLPDGQRVLSAGWERAIFQWDLATVREQRRFEPHPEVFVVLAPSGDGKYVLSGHGDGDVSLWDVATGKVLHSFKGHRGTVRAVALSRDGRRALSGAEDQTVRLWDIPDRRELRVLPGAADLIRSGDLSPDGKLALAGSRDGAVRLWDADTGKLVRTFRGHTGDCWAVAFAPDSRRAVWPDGRGHLTLWDVTEGRLLWRTDINASGVRGLAFSPDGRRILAGDQNGRLALCDAETGELLDRRQGAGALGVAWTPDGRRAVTTHFDKIVRVWQMPAPPPERVPAPRS